jgi:hypothetical protein
LYGDPSTDYAFISYSHDSEEHKDRVRGLAERLRTNGIPAVIDQYVPFPPEGWPAWMLHQIAEARHVLVICTEAYFKRAMGREGPRKGLGAIWESQVMTQAIYEAGRSNTKFFPVIFNPSDTEFIPVFLRPYTHFNVSRDDEFIRLLRVITDQPEHNPPPVGPRVILPQSPNIQTVTKMAELTVADSGSLVLLHPVRNGFIAMTSQQISQAGNNITLTLVSDGSIPNDLRAVVLHSDIALAYGDIAFLGKLTDLRIEREYGVENANLFFRITDSDYGIFSEPSYNNISADKIAEIRARRILLDNECTEKSDSLIDKFNLATMEVFIRGMGTPIQVKRSPLPLIYTDTAKADPNGFLQYARLVAIMFLRLTGTIDVVDHLALSLDDHGTLLVNFFGRRAKKYANRPPYEIRIEGSVNLLEAKTRSIQ